jgi:two-component system cell cycle response regulator DivK
MSTSTASISKASRRLPRVLIVEDHVDTREMYVEYLSGTFEVFAAGDGNEALAQAQKHRPDAVVTDLSLPGFDGFELCSRLRRDPTTSDAAVVCLSGFSGRSHEERARDAGVDRVVEKPCLPEALVRAIMETLEEHRDRARP